jgi:hypothetical protein
VPWQSQCGSSSHPYGTPTLGNDSRRLDTLTRIALRLNYRTSRPTEPPNNNCKYMLCVGVVPDRSRHVAVRPKQLNRWAYNASAEKTLRSPHIAHHISSKMFFQYACEFGYLLHSVHSAMWSSGRYQQAPQVDAAFPFWTLHTQLNSAEDSATTFSTYLDEKTAP